MNAYKSSPPSDSEVHLTACLFYTMTTSGPTNKRFIIRLPGWVTEQQRSLCRTQNIERLEVGMTADDLSTCAIRELTLHILLYSF